MSFPTPGVSETDEPIVDAAPKPSKRVVEHTAPPRYEKPIHVPTPTHGQISSNPLMGGHGQGWSNIDPGNIIEGTWRYQANIRVHWNVTISIVWLSFNNGVVI